MKRINMAHIQLACDESLIQAAANQDVEGVKSCLEAGANPLAEQCQAIKHAISDENLDMLRILLPPSTALHTSEPLDFAAGTNARQSMRYLLTLVRPHAHIDLLSTLLIAAQESEGCFNLLLPYLDPRGHTREIEDRIAHQGPDLIESLGHRCAQLTCRDSLSALVAQSHQASPSTRRRI